MLKFIASYIWSDNDNKSCDEKLEDAFKELENAQVSKKSEPEPEKPKENYVLERKIGHITSLNNFMYAIDEEHHFTSEHQKFSIGNKVSYTLVKDGSNTKITNVEEIIDDWVTDGTPDSATKTWCYRNIVGIVQKRSGRIISISDLEMGVDLNDVSCEFIPLVGDWVELETKVELDENVANLHGKVLEVTKVSPLRTKVIEGVIKTCNDHFNGTINRDASFNKDALIDGYIPKLNDKVIAEVIESNHNKCYWRALKIVLYSTVNRNKGSNVFDGDLQKYNTYQHRLEGVKFHDNKTVNSSNFNQVHVCPFSIYNERHDSITLTKIEIESNSTQVQLTSPAIILGSNCNIAIESKQQMEFIFTVTAKILGTCRETILFYFGKDCIARFIFLNLDIENVPKAKSMSHAYKNKYEQFESMKKSFQKPKEHFIAGERLKLAPRFRGKKLKDFSIPLKLESLCVNYENVKEYEENIANDLIRYKPCLREDLNYHNYEEKLHTLLYLEEIHYKLSMLKYDSDRACFINDPMYLILEIENLAESRPSIIVGDSIIATSLSTPDSFQGFVHKVTGSHVFLKFAPMFHQCHNGDDYQIRVKPSRALFIKKHNAITLARYLGKNVLFPTHINHKSCQVNFTYDPYYDTFRENNVVTNGSSPDGSKREKTKKELLLMLKGVASNRSNKNQVFKLEWFNTSLNYYQKEAVRNILLGEARPLPYIIFGPPGTGKTVTIIECILQILRLIPHSRLLVATPSNSAADLLTTRLINNGNLKPGDLIRVVSYRTLVENRIPPNLVPFCGTVSIAGEGTSEYENIKHESGVTLDVPIGILSRHRIIVGTCSSLGSLLQVELNPGHFTHVIVDEAGQCTEPEIMLPIGLVDVNDGQIILAGDPMQLGPVVLHKEAAKFGLAETYMERLLSRFPYLRDVTGFPSTGGYDPKLVTKLLYNYRALPDLLYIPNYCFYHSELRATISEADSEEAEFLNSLKSVLPRNARGKPAAMVFHGIIGSDQRGDDCPSWFNPDEASQIFYYLNEFYNLGVKSNDICIITPYIKQVYQIREILNQAEFDKPKIGTVEELQGQEYKIVLMSTVRSRGAYLDTDKKFALGFVSNPKRFNVALTRSRCLTIVVGNPLLLSGDQHWNELIQYCKNNKTYIGCTL